MKQLVKSVLLLLAIGVGLGGVASAAGDDFEGLIEASDMVEISSQVPGIIEQILVERGDLVSAGDEIVRLKSELEVASVKLAQTRLEFGKRKVSRNEELQRKKLISTHDEDEMETESLLNELQLREEEQRLQLRSIRSPITGVVVKRTLSVGEYVGEGSILTLARINPLFVEVIVPVSRYGSVHNGMRAEVRPESPVGGKYLGKVIVVDQVIDAASGTFGVRVELPNDSLQLPAGLKCQVRFLAAKKK